MSKYKLQIVGLCIGGLLAIGSLSTTSRVVPPATKYDIQNYLIPDSDSLDYRSPLYVKDLAAARLLGEFAFTMPGNTHGSCASCHREEKAGFSIERFAAGKAGRFDILYDKHTARVFKDHPEDVRTPPIINIGLKETGLTDGALGMKAPLNVSYEEKLFTSFKAENGYRLDGTYTQFFVGVDAHDIRPIFEKMRADTLFQALAKRAFAVHGLNELVVATATGIYQKTFLTTQAPFQDYLRGSLPNFKYFEGFEAFEEQECQSCHNSPMLGGQQRARMLCIQDEDLPRFKGFFRVTKDSSDLESIVIPGLYNLKDAPGRFVNNEDLTTYRAIKRHEDRGYTRPMSAKTRRDIARFIDYGLWDRNLERYMNNEYKFNETQY